MQAALGCICLLRRTATNAFWHMFPSSKSERKTSSGAPLEVPGGLQTIEGLEVLLCLWT